MTRVLVAADSAVVRAGLGSLVKGDKHLELAGSAASREELLDRIDSLHPDVVLLDARSAVEDVIAEVVSPDPARDRDRRAPALVILGAEIGSDHVVDALRAGASAILSSDASPDEIVTAIEAVAVGSIVLDRTTADSVLAGPPGAVAPDRRLHQVEPLTPREIEVLNMLAGGLGNKEIAARLGISDHTVKFHVGSIFNKLDATSRTEAVTLAIRLGLIIL